MLLPVIIMGCSSDSGATKLGIFAAAGAKPAIDDVCQRYEQRFGSKLEISYCGVG